MRASSFWALLLVGILTLTAEPKTYAQDVSCAAYKDKTWRRSFWEVGHHTLMGSPDDEIAVPALAEAMQMFEDGRRGAAMAMLTLAASTVNFDGHPPIQAIVAGYMLRILRACPELTPEH